MYAPDTGDSVKYSSGGGSSRNNNDDAGCVAGFLVAALVLCIVGFGIWMSQSTNSSNLTSSNSVPTGYVEQAVAAAKQVAPAGSNLAPRISVPAPVPAVSNPAPQPALLPCFTTNMTGSYGEIKQGPLDGGSTWGMQVKFNRNFSKGGWSNMQVIEIDKDQAIVQVFSGQTATLWFYKNC